MNGPERRPESLQVKKGYWHSRTQKEHDHGHRGREKGYLCLLPPDSVWRKSGSTSVLTVAGPMPFSIRLGYGARSTTWSRCTVAVVQMTRTTWPMSAPIAIGTSPRRFGNSVVGLVTMDEAAGGLPLLLRPAGRGAGKTRQRREGRPTPSQ